eukprot:GHRR01033268.1.p1 GENE.GHRR01033268.1~~GHRR01033268.1.p1  ORF type:complete len:206 (-),score=44.87 GHRR01033268.1:2423-3040(-)
MNPNYTEFKFPQIKAHPWAKVFSKRMPPDAIDLVSRCQHIVALVSLSWDACSIADEPCSSGTKTESLVTCVFRPCKQATLPCDSQSNQLAPCGCAAHNSGTAPGRFCCRAPGSAAPGAGFQLLPPLTGCACVRAAQVSRLLQYSPQKRFTAHQAMTHPFFDELRDPSTVLPNGKPLPPLFNWLPGELDSVPEDILTQLQPRSAAS